MPDQRAKLAQPRDGAARCLFAGRRPTQRAQYQPGRIMSEKKPAAESPTPAPDADTRPLGEDELEVIAGGAASEKGAKGKKSD